MSVPRTVQTAQAVQSYVARHLHEKITVREIAEALHLHPSYLNACFCAQCGSSVKTYIHAAKSREACRLLRGSRYSLTQIGAMLGYFDQSHFSRMFKQSVGMTPGQYRAGASGQTDAK